MKSSIVRSALAAAMCLLGTSGGIAQPAAASAAASAPPAAASAAASESGMIAWYGKKFAGRKTAAYRQIGNAFPPPVAAAVARQIFAALSVKRIYKVA